jgi:hypothetical protein
MNKPTGLRFVEGYEVGQVQVQEVYMLPGRCSPHLVRHGCRHSLERLRKNPLSCEKAEKRKNAILDHRFGCGGNGGVMLAAKSDVIAAGVGRWTPKFIRCKPS